MELKVIETKNVIFYGLSVNLRIRCVNQLSKTRV